MPMKWASAVSEEATLERALIEVVDTVRGTLDLDEPDFVAVFVSDEFRSRYEQVSESLNDEFEDALLLGCSAGGVIGGGREVERRAGLALVAACLPGVEITPLRLSARSLPEPNAPTRTWEHFLGVRADERPSLVILPDPFSFDPQPLLRGLDAAMPGSVTIGGLASGGRMPGSNALFIGAETFRDGAVGVALTGDIQMETIVAQGCRPIGSPMFVTRSDGGLLRELDGVAPTELLIDLYKNAEERDRRLFRQSLFLGIAMREREEQYGQGDFLVRNIVGMEPRAGILQVAGHLRDGQVVQFHLRDALTSSEDLASLLDLHRSRDDYVPPRGALLFSCLGRGIFLYGEPDHDTQLFSQKLGNAPLAGFFCNGEIGPVQRSTFLHGYTSSFGLFRPKHDGISEPILGSDF